MTATNSGGNFQVCGLTEGSYDLETEGACYLRARIDNVHLAHGGTVNLPYASLRGGDVNNDNSINLFDLVRVGADYRSAPPTDPEADCTEDNKIDLFDLVLVGSNYGLDGPTTWGGASMDSADPSDAVSIDEATVSKRGDSGAPLALEPRILQDGELAVDVTIRGAADIWGAELALRFDPEVIQVIDADTRPGLQIVPGDAWQQGSAWVAVNEADNESGSIRFVASRLKPATPLSGDLVLATIRLSSATGDAEGIWLTDVRVADSAAREIDVTWTGLDIRTRPAFRIFVPDVHNRPEG
jgi:hypothetical protein